MFNYLLIGAFILFLLAKPETAWATPEPGRKYEALFLENTNKFNLPAGLLSRIAYQESRYDSTAVSPVGALGLMQFMPGTAEDLGINPLDPEQSISGAARYLSWLYGQLGDWKQVLAAYNFGIGNVKKGREWPLETVNYVRDISADVGLV